MAVETKLDLNEKTIECLQELTRLNIDSAKGFRESADLVDNATLAEKMLSIADEREQQAQVLQQYVTVNCEEPREEGSYLAAMHRSWIKVRELFAGNDTHAVMAEAERGEDHIKDAYEDALKEHPGTAMNDVLQHQYAQVLKTRDLVRDLRDSCKDCDS